MPLFVTSGSQVIPLDGTSDHIAIEPDAMGSTIYVIPATGGTGQVEVSPDGVNFVPWGAAIDDTTGALDLPRACRYVRVTGATAAGAFFVEQRQEG